MSNLSNNMEDYLKKTFDAEYGRVYRYSEKRTGQQIQLCPLPGKLCFGDALYVGKRLPGGE